MVLKRHGTHQETEASCNATKYAKHFLCTEKMHSRPAMSIITKLRAEGRLFRRGGTLHGAESADASRAGMHLSGWVIVVCGSIMGSKV